MSAPPMSPIRRVRCAIYTRKSSDEGLEQSFNSLDAQREACAAYILSQASEGWSATNEHYDDGGLSGGTLARPALQRLLADIVAGRIDIVVVYKVDRLTRSLLDFAKLVEAFDKAGTSFVSITQSFNTTSSMGRLTLNMLLSFAQFEREVTAERIRDKIAASKAKGMWMGGIPPIGYKPNGRSLAIVDDHATFVRQIFELYLETGNVRRVEETLHARKLRAPDRITSTGKAMGGRPLSRGQLYAILKNRTYIGEVEHHGNIYPGLHQPIIDRDQWDYVQAKLADQTQGRRAGYEARRDLLAGKIVDGSGEPLVPTHSCKTGPRGTVRYRYYTAKALHEANQQDGMRIPAKEIETLVAERIGVAFDDPLALIAEAWLDVPADRLEQINLRARELAAVIRQKRGDAIVPLIERVRIGEQEVTITCSTSVIAEAFDAELAPDAPATIKLVARARVRRSGMAMRLIDDRGALNATDPNLVLIRSLQKARRWWAELRQGTPNVTALAERERCTPEYVARILRLAFLSPAVVDAILKGKQQAHVDVTYLTLRHRLAANWAEQEINLNRHSR